MFLDAESEAICVAKLMRTAANQQNSPEYLKLNPKGKVPTLLIDAEPLTENVAILSWLTGQFPRANLLPRTTDPLEALKQTADLAFFSATVHPLVTRIAMPLKFIDDAELSFEIVRPKAEADMKKAMKMIDKSLEAGPWWYGDTWSVVDGYLYWVWSRITGGGFPGEEFANITRHHALSNQRPAVMRAMARETAHVEMLKAEGLYRAPR